MNTFTPDFHYTQDSTFIYNGQLLYEKNHDARTNSNFIYTTDIDDPGKTLYFYRNGKFVTQLTEADAHTHRYFSIARGNVYPHSSFEGGEFNETVATKTVDGYRYNRYKFIDKINNKTYYSGEVITDGKIGNFDTFFVDGENIPIPVKMDNQPGVAAVINTMTNQTVTYINADTGQIMKQFTSKDTYSNSKYDLTNAAPNKVTFDGKTYERVTPENVKATGKDLYNQTYTSSNISDAAINKVIMTNNGIEIKAGDVWDEPLTGVVANDRKGDLTLSENSYQLPLVYISQQTDNKGTVDMNSYTLQSADSFTSDGYRIVRTTLMKGGTVPGAVRSMDGLSELDFPPQKKHFLVVDMDLIMIIILLVL